MSKAVALAAPSGHDPVWQGVIRFMLVSGCATALMLARYPLPF
ncbi:hypothetical protein [Sphingomonas sp. 35-24ZXX]|nr:hypothetical protein [Sphingomonas sp. 35-24ZXX]